MEVGGYVTVSYTHLDVYKRQVLADLKVEMGPCCHAGLSHGTDHLPGPDGVALLHCKVPALAI